jgi:signal transduction histidine kinase
MICPYISEPTFLIISADAPQLLYYSHIPVLILSLLVGLYILLKNRNSLIAKTFLGICLSFAGWVSVNLIVWTSNGSDSVMFFWSLFGLLFGLLLFFAAYFFHVFLRKGEDIPFLEKVVLFTLLLPVIVFTPTQYNLMGFDLSLCGATGFENKMFIGYYTMLGFILMLWILVLAFLYMKKASHDIKGKIIFLTVGIELFLFSFFTTSFLASYLSSLGLVSDFSLEFYGLFSMAIFLALLVYIIVRYKAFDIKLLGAQALVVGTIILIGSQFFFIRNPINQVLNGITLVLVSLFGFFLVRGVRREVEQRERLETLTTELQKTTKSLATANSKLESANKELERLDQSKSEFLSIASHQLRTPLTVIKGYTSMLQEGSFGKVPVKIAEVLDKVFISTERLISLVESLLNISRIEAGRIQFDMQPVDLTKTIAELVTDFQQKAAAKKLTLEFTPEKNVPAASADPQKVKEIISNLLDNAIKYTDKGSINIGLHQESQSIVFTSQDTGLGIEPEDLPRLFNKFVRGKGMQQVHTEGTGLGLYFARMVVEQMGGRIWAESEGKGKGSKFSFSLPMADKSKVTKIK